MTNISEYQKKELLLAIHGNNELNKVAKEIIIDLLPQLQKYVNTKIDTQNGMSKKFVYTLIKPIPKPLQAGHFASLHGCYLSCSNYDLKLKISICLSGGKYEDKTYYCQYFERTFYVGVMDKLSLVEIPAIEKLLNDYSLNDNIDLENEIKKIEQYKALKKQLEGLKSSIKIPFIDY